MSLSKLIEDKYKRYLNARVNNLTVDGNLNLAPQSVPISSLQSTGSVGFLHDDSVDIVRKNIEITDLQNIGVSAPNNTFLRHNEGSVSFQPIPGGGGSNPARQLRVAQSDGDFTSIGSAITAASALTPTSSNPVEILVFPGTYVENSLILPSFVNLVGVDPDSVILQGAGYGSSSIVLASNPNVLIRNLTFTTCQSGIFVENSEVYIQDCKMTNCFIGVYCFTNALCYIHNIYVYTGVNDITSGVTIQNNGIANIKSCRMEQIGAGMFDKGIQVVSNTSRCYISSSVFNSLEAGFEADDGISYISNCNFRNCFQGLVQSGSTVYASSVQIFASVGQESIVQQSATDVLFFDGVADKNKFNRVPLAQISGSFFSEGLPDVGQKILSELSVGEYDFPYESSFGAGDSTIKGMRLFRTTGLTGVDPTNFTEITSSLNTPAGSAPLFDTGATDDSFLIGSDFIFEGIKIALSTAINPRTVIDSINTLSNIRLEYWNGSNWISSDIMSTTDVDPFTPEANQVFELGEYQYRFGRFNNTNARINNMARKTLNGLNLYWVRFIVGSLASISTIPVATLVKIHTNRTEIDSTGFIQYFGDAQPYRRVNLPIKNYSTTIAAPSSQNVWLGNNFGISITNNRFTNVQDDQLVIATEIPNDLDTSKGVDVIFRFVPGSAVAGDVLFELSIAVLSDFDDNITANSDIYTSNPVGSPARFQTFNNTFSIPMNNDEKARNVKQSFSLFPYFGSRDTGSNLPDLMFIKIKRLATNVADTYTGDISLFASLIRYYAWNNGINR